MRMSLHIALVVSWLFVWELAISQESQGVQLLAQWKQGGLPASTRGSVYNDVWGFVEGGQEYAVIGSTAGSHIIHVGYNHAVTEVAFIPGTAQGAYAVHRDFAYYKGYLYIVGDEPPALLQVVDVRGLPGHVDLVLETDAFFTTAHNLRLDEAYGWLYAAGPSGHALTLLDLEPNPAEPQLIRHFDGVEYVHDLYVRDGVAYLNCAFQGLWVYAFNDPENPVLLGTLEDYPQSGYNHSGWLNEEGTVYVFADETPGKALKVCSAQNLAEIDVLSLLSSQGASHTTPHNVMIKEHLAYVSYYFDGFQVFDIREPQQPKRVAWFRTYQGDLIDYQGAWGVYVFLPSGRILVSDRQSGLFVFSLISDDDVQNNDVQIIPNHGAGDAVVHIRRKNFLRVDMRVCDASGRLIQEGTYRNTSDSFWMDVDLNNEASGYYFIGVRIDDGDEYQLKYLKY
ncbi:MAG: hypothetical protein RL226_1693 [Bacteroidota bacterium]